jgi:hypothetical protein
MEPPRTKRIECMVTRTKSRSRFYHGHGHGHGIFILATYPMRSNRGTLIFRSSFIFYAPLRIHNSKSTAKKALNFGRTIRETRWPDCWKWIHHAWNAYDARSSRGRIQTRRLLPSAALCQAAVAYGSLVAPFSWACQLSVPSLSRRDLRHLLKRPSWKLEPSV